MKLTKEEALQKIKELQDYIKQEDEVTLVPDNIRIEIFSGIFGDSLRIVFPDGKKSLGYSNDINDFIVGGILGQKVKCKLVKVDKSDLKKGYTYYHSDYGLYDNDCLGYYCKYLGDGKYVYIGYGDVIIRDGSRENWYQVVVLD